MVAVDWFAELFGFSLHGFPVCGQPGAVACANGATLAWNAPFPGFAETVRAVHFCGCHVLIVVGEVWGGFHVIEFRKAGSAHPP